MGEERGATELLVEVTSADFFLQGYLSQILSNYKVPPYERLNSACKYVMSTKLSVQILHLSKG